MASGWAGDNAVNDHIASSLENEIARVQENLPKGESLEFCEECDEAIPKARQQALPGVRLCITCQEEIDNEPVNRNGYNRRGSKDSQLR